MAKKLNEINNLPQLTGVFAGWMNTLSIIVITQNVVNGFVVDTERQITFKGIIQPLSPKTIALKPEGQRAFEWLQIHCMAGSLNLQPNDRIIINEQRYKIMAQNDYSRNGYIEYHAIEDYPVAQ